MGIENGSIPSAFLLRLKFWFILLQEKLIFQNVTPLLLTFHTLPGPFHDHLATTNLFQLSMHLLVLDIYYKLAYKMFLCDWLL